MYKNNLRQIAVLLYKLKRNFGRKLTLRKFVSVTQDVTTGKQTQVFTSHAIRRAIVMPYSRARDFIYDLTFVAANKNFTYGAFFDRASTAVIIDKADIPDLTIQPEDDLVIDEVRYQIVNTDETEGNTAYLLKVKALRAADKV